MTPNADHDRLQQSAKDNLMLHFSKQQVDDLLVLDRGEGPYVYDTTGRQYIDALSSLFCSQLGYSYGDEMAEAAADQLRRLSFNTTWGTAHPPAIELAEKISDLAPADDYRVFFTGGGSESVESAWKLVREHFIAIGQPQRTKAIARRTAYHGVTLGALSFTGVPAVQGRLRRGPDRTSATSRTPTRSAPRTPTTRRPSADGCSPRSRTRSSSAGADEVALIIAEPIQNAGGCLDSPTRLLDGAADARRHVRRAADGRRGDHRVRPHRRVVRRLARGRGPRPDQRRQGADVRLRAHGRDAGPRPGGGAAGRAGQGLPARHHLRRAPAERRAGLEEHRDHRARPGAGERAGAGRPAGSVGSPTCSTCRSSATSEVPASSGRWSS